MSGEARACSWALICLAWFIFHRGRSAIAYLDEACPCQQIAQVGAVEAQMEHAGVVAVESAVFAIKVGEGDLPAGIEQPEPFREQRGGVRHMVRHHAAHDQVVAAARMRAVFKIDELGSGVGDALCRDLAGHHFQHGGRAVRAA